MPLPRRLRSFSLRTLLVLVGVACMLAAWVARERSVVMERRAAMERWRGAMFWWDHPDSDRTAWHRRLLGDHALLDVRLPASASDSDIANVARLFPEARVERWSDSSPLRPSRPPERGMAGLTRPSPSH
jgi:hypothetical protein